MISTAIVNTGFLCSLVGKQLGSLKSKIYDKTLWYVYLIYVCAQNLISWKRLSLVSLKSWIITDSIDIHNHFSSFLYSFHLCITFTYNFSSFHLYITFTYNFSSFFYSFHLCITFTKCLFILFQITLKQKCVRHKFSASSLLEKLFAHRQEIYFWLFSM